MKSLIAISLLFVVVFGNYCNIKTPNTYQCKNDHQYCQYGSSSVKNCQNGQICDSSITKSNPCVTPKCHITIPNTYSCYDATSYCQFGSNQPASCPSGQICDSSITKSNPCVVPKCHITIPNTYSCYDATSYCQFGSNQPASCPSGQICDSSITGSNPCHNPPQQRAFSLPFEPFTTVFIGNITYTTTVGTPITIFTDIPSAQYWTDGSGHHLAKWYETVNGVAVSKFMLQTETPTFCQYSGDEIRRTCAAAVVGSIDNYELGFIPPFTANVISETTYFTPDGIRVTEYVAATGAGCSATPPVSPCLIQTWRINTDTGDYLYYKLVEIGTTFTRVEEIEYLWLVHGAVNANLFVKPAWCTGSC